MAMAEGRRDRVLCGWRVSSDLPLPDLPLWQGDDRPADLTIRCDPNPPKLGDLSLDRQDMQIGADGFCRFAVPDVATYLIDPHGRSVVVTPAEAAAPQDIRLFLFGTVLGILCARRGLLPLHAGSVRIGEGAVAFAGDSGMGKSTLAAAFIKRGYAILSDDVTAVETDGRGCPRIRPSLPRLKLCPDAVARLGIPTDNAERVSRDADKFNLPLDGGFYPLPLPLRAIFHLRPASEGEPTTLRRLSPAQSLVAVADDTYRPALMHWLDRDHRRIHAGLAMARVPGGVWQLSYRHGPDGPDAALNRILEVLDVRMPAPACPDP